MSALAVLGRAKMRQAGEKIAMLTCYDASFAQLLDEQGVDVLLIGDSLGMVLQGLDSTLPVTLEHMAYHTAAVARGSRRALVLIDPSYETRGDYSAVVKGLQEALKRFATGTYALWYPMLSKLESRQLPDRLKSLGARNWLHATLEVKAPARDGFGMHGSGMFIINPPWTLEQKLHQCLPQLAELLAQGEGARHGLESQST